MVWVLGPQNGLIGVTRALSAEPLTKSITVNAICPGYVRTPIVDCGVTKIIAKTGRTPEDVLKAMVDASQFGRLTEPEEVAAAALYLCGPSSDAITGQAIQIAGGHV